MTIALERFIADLEQDRSLYQPDRMRQRLEVLDRLDALVANGISFAPGAHAANAGIDRRARRLYDKLELANLELYESIRSEIQNGAGPGILLHWANESRPDVSASGRVSGQGYDYLDELISGVLQLEKPRVETFHLEPEMVFYQPTPARHIFNMIGRIALSEHDTLIDLGSGLGHVPLLTAICTSARCIGIELEAAYVDSARQSADALKLRKASFIQQDARTADLSGGTVFYLYTPFVGAILGSVLDLLRQEAASREIRVCTFGPCTAMVAEERWLEADGAIEADRVAVFYSCD
jgi:hypothetical protein